VVEQLRNIGIINSTTRSHLVSIFCKIHKLGIKFNKTVVAYSLIFLEKLKETSEIIFGHLVKKETSNLLEYEASVLTTPP